MSRWKTYKPRKDPGVVGNPGVGATARAEGWPEEIVAASDTYDVAVMAAEIAYREAVDSYTASLAANDPTNDAPEGGI